MVLTTNIVENIKLNQADSSRLSLNAQKHILLLNFLFKKKKPVVYFFSHFEFLVGA